MYDYGIIDAQYLLRRNKVVIERTYGGKLLKNKLIESFLNSVMKLKRENDFIYPILCWDKSPYLKTEAVKEYKQNRHHASEEEVLDLKDQISSLEEFLTRSDITDEQRSEAENKIKELKQSIENSILEMENFKVFQSVKYDIIFQLSDTGFKSMIKSGFEADDLGYLLSKQILKENKTAILLTVDKDWVFFQNDNVVFRSIKYPDKKYLDLTDSWNNHKDVLSMYEYGVLYEILEGSHNNVTSIITDVKFSEAINRFINNDETLPSFTDIKVYFSAMNVNNYESQITNLIYYVLNYDNHKVMNGKLRMYCQRNFINLNYDNYLKFIKELPTIPFDPNIEISGIVE